jgi:hypothetical protein
MPHKGNLYALRLIGSLWAVHSGRSRPEVLRRAWSCLLINAAELLERSEGATLVRARADLRSPADHLRVDTFVLSDNTPERASITRRLVTSVRRFSGR